MALGQTLLPTNTSIALAPGSNKNIIVTFSEAALKQGQLALGKRFTISQTQLTADQLSVLRSAIIAKAASTNIPWYVTPFIPSSVAIESEFVKLALDELQSLTLDTLANQTATANQFVMFLAGGGRLLRAGVLEQNTKSIGEFILVDMTEYVVSLGSETRTFLLASCLYPARPRITQIVLTYANGGTTTFAESNDNNWKLNGSLPLQEYAEDDDYIYFQEICNPTNFCVRHRIGKWIGSWGDSFEQQDSLDGPRYYPNTWDMSGSQPIKVLSQ